MSTDTDYKFVGYMGLDKDCVKNGKLVQQEFTPKPFTEDDVDLKITHCGICGTDIHVLRAGWGAPNYPTCAGHEIIGTAVRVGANVKGIKIGDRVGVGPQSGSCGECEECKRGLEQYCRSTVGTYDSKYPDGSKTYGGFANYSRVPGAFAFKIPDGLPSEMAAPLLCGGATVYSPLVNNGCGPGKTVGIIGIGGLGHMAILLAKTLGADKVVAISRSSSKKADAIALGADSFIATNEDENWAKTHSRSIDLIVSTVDGDMPLIGYLSLLSVGGTLMQVGAPEVPLPQITATPLIFNNIKIGGSLIASRKEIREMLDLVARKGVKPWTNLIPMREVGEALRRFEKGEPRYRFVLYNEN